jgi:rubrerythrin
MPNSLRNKIKHLAYKGELNERERDRILNALDNEQKQGEWIDLYKEGDIFRIYKCSNCNFTVDVYELSKCCPRCGCRMNGGGASD